MKQLTSTEKALLTEQLALTLESGLPLSSALEQIALEIDNNTYKETLHTIAVSLDEGKSFASALKESHLLDDYMIEMINIGEESGYLDRVMRQLSLYYTRLYQTQLKLKDAITYPSILILMTSGVIGLLLFKVLPLFNQILANIGVQLSPLAHKMMQLSQVMSKYGVVIIFILIAIVIYLYTMNRKGKGFNHKFDYELQVAQFAFGLSLYMQAGIDIESALVTLIPMFNNKCLKQRLILFQSHLQQGMVIEDALKASQIFKSMYNRILVIGFKSGKGDEMMEKVAHFYENEVDRSINKMLDIIEPSLVAILAVVVGIILLVIMLPLTSIMSNL